MGCLGHEARTDVISMVRGEQVTATGAWSIPPAFSYKVDVGIVDGISQLAGNNASVLDIGAGKGLYVRALRARALRADGVDGVANIGALTDGLKIGVS
jgi:hypothetical protein